MYFGSVKFFRHLILTVFFGWLGAATILAVFFGVKCYMMRKEAESAQSGVQTSKSIEAYIDEMTAAGYSHNDIMDALNADGGFPDPANEGVYSEIAPDTPVNGNVSPNDSFVQTAAPYEETTEQTQASEQTSAEETLPREDMSYTELYPEMYVEKAAETTVNDKKTVFLAFEDGPSVNTYDILYILNKHNIKATFFMSAGKTESCIEQMSAVSESGHTIGVHSFSHDPGVIYSSVENYLADFYETFRMIYSATGIIPAIYSLPDSGAIPEDIKAEIIAEMDRRGFTLFECNAESGDRSPEKSWQYILDTSTASIAGNETASIVHMHDSADDYTTVLTLDDVIKELESEGYTFAPLSSGMKIE